MDALKCYFCYNNKISFLSDVSNETVRNEIRRRFEGNNDRFNDCYDENGMFLPENATVLDCPHDSDVCAAGEGILTLTYLGRLPWFEWHPSMVSTPYHTSLKPNGVMFKDT